MPKIDLSMLNQRQTPAFYADVLANRPAAGFIGRIFVSTNTYAFYRDNGTGWDLIGGPGTGTVTGSGTAGQVTYWDGASSITGSNNLFWDSAAGHLGINTNTPGTGLDVHDTTSTILQLNTTTATNDTRIAFQNAGTSLWRIGNFYNAGANDWGIYDVVGAAQPLTIKKTTGQVLIGTSTVGAGKLVVSSASADNGVQVVGASAPSLRIDNAATGATKRAGLGISTATNNFIQGSADRDFCIFNGSTAAASPILFGVYDAGAVNVQEAARISAARNFLIGTTTDAGQKLQVSGTALITGNSTFNAGLNVLGNLYAQNSNGNIRLKGQLDGFLGCGASNNNLFLMDWATATKGLTIDLSTGAATFSDYIYLSKSDSRVIGGNGSGRLILANSDVSSYISIYGSSNGNSIGIISNTYVALNSGGSYGETMRASSSNNVLIGTTTDNGNKLQINGNTYSLSGFISPGPSFEPTSGTGWLNAAFRSQANTSPYGGGIALIDGTSGWVMYAISSGTNFRIASATTSTTPTTQFQINTSGNALLSGSIQTGNPSGGTAQAWKLGNYTAGVAVQAGKVRVEIGGVAYDLLTA